MKMMRNLFVSVSMVLLSAPLISGQDLSKYRKFSLGTSLVAVSRQIGQDPSDATLLHQSPAVIQELTYWPIEPYSSSGRVEPVTQILFSFYNGELYRIVVTYDRRATEGLTDEDMVRAISTRYGTGTRLYPEINFPTSDAYTSPDKVIARWEDSQNSVNFLRSTSMNSSQLVVFSIRLDAQASIAIAKSVKMEDEEAPQKEIARQKKVAEDLEMARQVNQKTFRP